MDAITRVGVSGAVVTLTGVGSTRLSIPAQVTDSRGRFVFDRLQVGRYRLSAKKGGYASGEYQFSPLETHTIVDAAGGGWSKDTTIPLWPFASIGGTITDENGEPLTGVVVRVLCRAEIAGTDRWATGPSTLTDDRGRFSIQGLRSGQYLVQVPSISTTLPPPGEPVPVANRRESALSFTVQSDSRIALGPFPRPAKRGAASEAYPPTVFGGGAGTLVELGWGDVREGIDIALLPSKAYAVAGVLLGPRDAIGGVPLRILSTVGPAGASLGAESGATVTDSDGRFEFLKIAPGDYWIEASGLSAEYVQVSDDETSPAEYSDFARPVGVRRVAVRSIPVGAAALGTYLTVREANNSTGRPQYAGRAFVTVHDSLRDIQVEMVRLAQINGELFLESSSDASRGAPKAGSLFLEPASADVPTLPARVVSSEYAGDVKSFVIPGVPPGNYWLRLDPRASWVIKAVSSGGVDLTHRPLTVPTEDIRVSVTLTDRSSEIDGEVTDANGKAVPGAKVYLFPLDRQQWTMFGLNPSALQRIRATSTGEFRFSGIVAGRYFLLAATADSADLRLSVQSLAAAATKAETIQVEWGRPSNKNLTAVVLR